MESHWQCAKDSNAKAKTVQPNKEGEFCYTKNVFLLLQTPTLLMAGSGAKQVYSCDLSRQFSKTARQNTEDRTQHRGLLKLINRIERSIFFLQSSLVTGSPTIYTINSVTIKTTPEVPGKGDIISLLSPLY